MVMTIFLSLQKATCGYPRPQPVWYTLQPPFAIMEHELQINSASH